MQYNWYKSFKLDNNIKSKITNIDDYVNHLNIDHNVNLDIKIKQIENEYNNKIEDIKNIYSNIDLINVLKKKNSYIILQQEMDIIKILTKYTLINKTLDYIFFKSCLTLLLELSEVLRTNLGQKEIFIDNKNKINILESNISRCSYKFCNYQDKCTYNYSSTIKNLCYQDHYVHNMVSADVKILLIFIDTINNNGIITHSKEILKTINTLSYVICHMETELKNRCSLINESKWNANHVIKKK